MKTVRKTLLYMSLSSNTLVCAYVPPPTTENLSQLDVHLKEELNNAASEIPIRNPAQARIIDDSRLSPEFKKFRKDFLATDRATKIDPLLLQLDKNYNSYPNDLKYVAAQLIPLMAFKSFIWKCVPMLENADAKYIHSVLITTTRQVASGQQIFFPSAHWKAGFDYVTQPFVEKLKRFENSSDFQNFLATELYSALSKSAGRIKDINLANQEIVIDNQLIYGQKTFQDNLDRYVSIAQADIHATYASINALLAGISMLSAYNLSGLFNTLKEVGKLSGLDGFYPFEYVNGAPASRRVKIIRAADNTLLTLNNSGYQWLDLAYKHLRIAVSRARKTWDLIKQTPADEYARLNSAKLLPFKRETELSLKNIEAMIEGVTPVRSYVASGSYVTVDLPALFINRKNSKPIRDLKDLLPTQFEGGDKMIDGPFGKYRNYYYGRPVGWDLQTYRTFLPKVSDQRDIPSALNIISQSWGGWALVLPISFLYL